MLPRQSSRKRLVSYTPASHVNHMILSSGQVTFLVYLVQRVTRKTRVRPHPPTPPTNQPPLHSSTSQRTAVTLGQCILSIESSSPEER